MAKSFSHGTSNMISSFCHPGASWNKSGINSSAIGFMLLVAAFCLTACGDDSGTSAKEESSSSFVIPDGACTEPAECVPGSASTSSNKMSSSSRVNSVGSSSVVKSSSSSSVKKTSSSSSKVFTCSVEGELVERKNKVTREYEWYICKDGISVLYYFSSSSQKVLTFKENFKKDSVFNDQIEYGTFKDPRDNQEYKTVVIKVSYVNLPEFEVFAQNLNYGTQIKLGTTEFDDKKVEKYCYDDDPWYCENYFGGMYSWSEAMGLPKACDSVWTGTTPECPDSAATGLVSDYEWDELQIQGACPDGWHLMNRHEWMAMIGANESIGYLLSYVSYSNGFSNRNGFSALLTGIGGCSDSYGCKFQVFAEEGDFWFPKETEKEWAGYMLLRKDRFTYGNTMSKSNAMPIRCVKDYKITD